MLISVGTFEIIKCIISIAPVGNLEKSREKHSPNIVRKGTRRWPERPVCCQFLARLGLSTGRTAPDVGYSLFTRPVWPVFSRDFLTRHQTHRSEFGAQRPVLVSSADLSAHESGGAPSPVRYEFYKLSTYETGEYRTRPMLT